MAINTQILRNASTRRSFSGTTTLNEAKRRGLKTAFLSHSHKDAVLATGLTQLLQEEGWQVYIDWQDHEMPESPNRETAQRIKDKITEYNYFLFLATSNSMASRWCPWEIGYADGKKQINQIIVIPTQDGGRTYGNEYLQLYRRLDVATDGKLAVWEPGAYQNGLYARYL